MTSTLSRSARSDPPEVAESITWLDASASLSLPDVDRTLGGKGASLARLAVAGLPVPLGFVIHSDAFASRDGVGDAGGALLAPRVPENAIRAAYLGLARRLGKTDPPVAVRSSGAAEDLAGASFAGQYDTFLGVRSADDVVAHVSRCWQSLFSERAAAYRAHVEQSGAALPEAAMAVVVQTLVDAEAGGVAFTADPLTGDSANVIVNGAWGLGQSVVDGEVEADTWRVDRRSLEIVELRTGDKATRSGMTPDASRVPVPDDLRRRPCLAPAQVAEVARLAVAAEAITGGAADVEWAFDGQTMWLLQARPVTTGVNKDDGAPKKAVDAAAKPEAQAPRPVGSSPQFPSRWPDEASAQLHWERLGANYGPALVLKPLHQDVATSFRRGDQNAGLLRGRDKVTRLIWLNGVGYTARVAAPGTPEELALRKQSLQKVADALHARGESYGYSVLLPELEAGNQALLSQPVDDLPLNELAAHVERAFRWYERAWTLHWLWMENTPTDRFIALYKEVTGEDGDQATQAARELLTHTHNKLVEAVDGLMDLARIAQRLPALRRLFLEREPAEVLARLDETEGGAELRARLDALLAAEGLRCGDGFGTEGHALLPGWIERPDLVIALTQKYVPQDLDALSRARTAAIAARDEKVAAVRARITDETKQKDFDFWLAAARRQASWFEDHNYYIDSAAGALLHRAVMAAARRLVAAGVLPDAEDVWWLHEHELVQAVRGIEPGSAETSDETPRQPLPWGRLLEARRAEYAWREQLAPPEWIGAPKTEEPRQPERPSQPGAPSEPEPDGVVVRGQAGSKGAATGRVRLISKGTMVPDVVAGDVLVAHNAGPLWTPVFPTVAAVVLDDGVLFQHAMLTCREYGVPAVFQTKNATTTLQEGQRVTVDGTHGWVIAAG